MLTEYITHKLSQAKYKLLGDGSYFGEVPSLKGVWSDAKTLEECREELREVLESWLIFRMQRGLRVPGFEMPSFEDREVSMSR